jgi:hypothetical protein
MTVGALLRVSCIKDGPSASAFNCRTKKKDESPVVAEWPFNPPSPRDDRRRSTRGHGNGRRMHGRAALWSISSAAVVKPCPAVPIRLVNDGLHRGSSRIQRASEHRAEAGRRRMAPRRPAGGRCAVAAVNDRVGYGGDAAVPR